MNIPQGFRLAGVHCGIKRNAQRPDITLILCDRPAVAAGVYTQNQVFAAPVQVDRERTPNDSTRVVVANSGNANACTGSQGLEDARAMCALAADACGVTDSSVLVMSTGIIGQPLPMQKIERGIRAAADQLADSEQGVLAAARGIMTTDTVPKVASRSLDLQGTTVRLLGIAKGAGMIGPRMATMLSVILTDATLDPSSAQELLDDVVQQTFNCISVEGHTSTNDTVLLLASGAAGGVGLSDGFQTAFRGAVTDLATELARAIPADGEGATHLITIDVCGCQRAEEARTIAGAVANSPLVKTAIAGGDPNWGRIVSAAGYAGVPFAAAEVDLRLNGCLLYRQGMPVAFDAQQVSASIREHRETSIELSVGSGPAAARFWTSDLTAEYVRINADYHT
ncbi:MAG: bifunctional glutamate N-acetyltransferase/amino-acid acetyltransferase ArgJ [Planctomycetales bacterium]|nr:bifunctional glutamate N-acetyltransferase/amino-acid acetyltransferase ArgJ [Planctomycetales bacterium]